MHAASRDVRNLERRVEKMSKNKLLMAIAAGVFTATAATGALAQTSSANSSNATAAPTASPMQDSASSGTMKHKKPRKQSAHSSATKKTPEAETGNNPAAESGQSK
jgi:hypothetical protein